VSTCRCCSSADVVPVLDLGLQPWGNDFIKIEEGRESRRYPLVFSVCRVCTMAQIGYTVPKEVMFLQHNYVSGTTRQLRAHFESVGQDILGRVAMDRGDYIVDIGGNDGTFLVPLRDRGVNVLNIESAGLQAEISHRKGLRTVNAFFNEQTALEVREKYGPARVIHGAGVLFHLEELHSAFAGIKALLHPQGTLVAEFIYLPTMIESNAFDQIYHEHLVYYTLRSFGELLRRHGLRIADASLRPIHGGSCVAWIEHEDRASETAAVAELRRREDENGFGDLDVYRRFSQRVADLRTSLVDAVRALRRDGKRIQALGAPVKGSTIINYCGLTEDDIECAVEINEFKIGTHYPGTRIPVRYQDAVPPPDVYLLLAWNFKDEILGKLAAFRERGGRVLVPIPTPELI